MLFRRPPATPDRHLVDGDPPVSVAIRRSAAARRLTLRVSRLDGRATLTLPSRLPWSEALAFLRDRADWLRAQVLSMTPAPGSADALPFRGALLRIESGPVTRLTRREDALILPQGQARGPRLTAFLRAAARDDLARACDRHAAAVGRGYRKLTLRDTRSRWGSCSSAGDLMFSWRLVMAPPMVLDYVAAHEVAHLVHMDHSPAFWAVVERLMPGYQDHRAWLRSHGDGLHRVVLDG